MAIPNKPPRQWSRRQWLIAALVGGGALLQQQKHVLPLEAAPSTGAARSKSTPEPLWLGHF